MPTSRRGPSLAADGTIYVATNAGTLHALDPLTGADVWTFDGGSRYGSDLSTTAAVLADGTILWPGPANTLFALDPAGHLLWRQTFAGFVLSPTDRGDGRVYVMDMAGTLTALDVGPGGPAIAWTVHLGATSYGSPAIAPDKVVTTVDDQVVAVRDDGAAGVVRWRWRAPATIEVSPAGAPDGTVVVGPNDEYAYGIGADGILRWRWRKDPAASASRRHPLSILRATSTSGPSSGTSMGSAPTGGWDPVRRFDQRPCLRPQHVLRRTIHPPDGADAGRWVGEKLFAPSKSGHSVTGLPAQDLTMTSATVDIPWTLPPSPSGPEGRSRSRRPPPSALASGTRRTSTG